jgi:Na+/H+ antiporter NhaD/arsenite permease-like protein
MFKAACGRVINSIQRGRVWLNDSYQEQAAQNKERLRVIWNKFSEGHLDTIRALRICVLVSLTLLLVAYGIHKLTGIPLKVGSLIKEIVLSILEHIH